MALKLESGPRDWSPRGMVWVLLKDTPQGYDVAVFKQEKDAYKEAVGAALPWVVNRFEEEDVIEFKKMMKEKEYEAALVFYHEKLDEYSLEKVPYYSILDRQVW